MKTIMLGLVAAMLAGNALALDRLELDRRIHVLAARFDEMQRRPNKWIPPDLLLQARGIILLDRSKAGFIFAYQGGAGVAMVRDPKTDEWSPAAFVHANEGSLGFQIGAEQNFFVILIMNTNATRLLTESNIEFGGEARGTVGDATAGAEGKVIKPESPILVFDYRKGLFGGAALKAGAFAPDGDANRIYYEQYVDVKDILFDKKVKPTETTMHLIEKINRSSKDSKS
jgi:lipid-binding SYLF domain-containing protein